MVSTGCVSNMLNTTYAFIDEVFARGQPKLLQKDRKLMQLPEKSQLTNASKTQSSQKKS